MSEKYSNIYNDIVSDASAAKSVEGNALTLKITKCSFNCQNVC